MHNSPHFHPRQASPSLWSALGRAARVLLGLALLAGTLLIGLLLLAGLLLRAAFRGRREAPIQWRGTGMWPPARPSGAPSPAHRPASEVVDIEAREIGPSALK
jgi:hypothetical protein